MKKLSLSQWTSIAEIAGMIAVVISLIFVGLEIRQNTDQVKAASMETGVGFVKAVLDMPNTIENASFIRRGLNDFDSLSAEEKMVFDSKLSIATVEFENITKLYAQGNIDEDYYNSYELMLASIYLSPGGKTWFERTKVFYPEGTEQTMREMMEKYSDSITLSEYFQYAPTDEEKVK